MFVETCRWRRIYGRRYFRYGMLSKVYTFNLYN